MDVNQETLENLQKEEQVPGQKMTSTSTGDNDQPSSDNQQQQGQQTTDGSKLIPPNKSAATCRPMNVTAEGHENRVKLVNGSYLTRTLSESQPNECFLVMFYVPWCPFSARLAPIYNALPRAFSNLSVFAFDVSKSIGYNTKFGTSAVPMVLLFQNKNVHAKFNYTDKNLTEFIDFVAAKTGFKPDNVEGVSVEDEDFEGPVPTVPLKQFDYFLLISWLFLLFVCVDFMVRKTPLRLYIFTFLTRLIVYLRGEPNQIDENQPMAIENNNNRHPHSD